MEVGLTFAIKIQWIDPRLTYSNVLNEPFEDAKTVKILGRLIQKWTYLFLEFQMIHRIEFGFPWTG